MNLLENDGNPLMIVYKRVFTPDECSDLIGTLLYKHNINWVLYDNNLNQRRSMVAFSNGRKSRYVREDPHPLSKHSDIFGIIDNRLNDVIQKLGDNVIASNLRRFDQWTCYLYENGDDNSPEIDLDFQLIDTPIVLVILGKSRYIDIRSKKTKKTVIDFLAKEGSVIVFLHPFDKYYTLQVPIVECGSLQIQLFGNFIKW